MTRHRFLTTLTSQSRLHTMIESQVRNREFCLGLVLHMFVHLDNRNISPSVIRSWYYCFRHHALPFLRLSDMIRITEFSKYNVAGKIAGGTFDNASETPSRRPMERDEISGMFANMVQLGWYKEAVEFLREFALRRLCAGGPGFTGDIFHLLWLPFFADVFRVYRRPDDQNWREIDPILRDVFLGVLVLYTVCIVGREPGKGNLRRAELSPQCTCLSCQAINTFLADGTKTRQLFQVIHKKKLAAKHLTRQWNADHSTYTISRIALSHIVRQLDDRDCACHTRETKAAGPVLVLHKRDNERVWRAWNDRRETARGKLREFGCLEEIFGEQHAVWGSLAFLERASPLEFTTPFTMVHTNSEVDKTLLDIRQMLLEMLSLVRQVGSLSWKTVTLNSQGLVFEWQRVAQEHSIEHRGYKPPLPGTLCALRL